MTDHDQLPPSFRCAITQEIMRSPMVCADGHTYEEHAIRQWFATGRRTSPKTNLPLPNTDLIPNLTLRSAIEEYVTQQLKHLPRAAFTIGRPLGRGSFKAAFEGTLRGQPVAVLQPASAVYKEMIEREASRLVKLGRHPNLVRYLGCCKEGDELFLLTELARLGSIEDVMQREGGLSLEHICVVLRQVCAGMEALAGEGVVHRDLAARNVLVFEFDRQDPLKTLVKVGDFGLSVELHNQGRTHYTVGSSAPRPVRYMSPEALRKGWFSEKSDVWAWAVTAWELLTDGDIPYFDISSDDAVIAFVTSSNGRLPRPPRCPDALWQLMLQCFAERPADRPSFRTLAASLGGHVMGADTPGGAAHKGGARTTQPVPPQPAVVQQTVVQPAPSSPTPPPPQPAVVHVPPGTTLHSAAQGGNTEHVRALLDRGGEVDGRDELQSTPLHYAAYFGHTDTARLLLDRGADVNAKNVFQATPLHDAASIGRTDTARLLLDRGADVNAKDKDQWTPLHNAAYFGHTDTARLLLDRGADVNAKDRDGKTPLKIAIDRNKSEVAALLRARGGLQ